MKVGLLDFSGAKFLRQQVRGRDGVLNRKIDSHAANGGHRMRGIANAKEAVPMPFPKAIDFDGEELDIVPAGDFVHTRAQERGAADNLFAKCFKAPRLPRLEAAFPDHVGALPIIASVQQHGELIASGKTESLGWIVRMLG
jgi:hypothetical protein